MQSQPIGIEQAFLFVVIAIDDVIVGGGGVVLF